MFITFGGVSLFHCSSLEGACMCRDKDINRDSEMRSLQLNTLEHISHISYLSLAVSLFWDVLGYQRCAVLLAVWFVHRPTPRISILLCNVSVLCII